MFSEALRTSNEVVLLVCVCVVKHHNSRNVELLECNYLVRHCILKMK